jgi:hypothetical protein
MKTYIDDEKVLLALKEIAKNLVYFTDNPLPKYPQMQGGGFFTIGFDGEKKAEVFIHGVKEEELNDIVSFLNLYTYYNNTMFGKGIERKVSVEKLLPYITLCKEKTYKSQITGRIVHFN